MNPQYNINRNLEQVARQLYDYWFVQFDFQNHEGKPYKSSGGEMIYNRILKHDIPYDWQVLKLSEVAEVYNGATPSTTDEENYGNDYVWVTPKDLSDQKSKFTYWTARSISKKGYYSCSTHLLPQNSILMSSRAPIGLLSIAGCEVCTNQGFKSFVCKGEKMYQYLYYYLHSHMKQIEQLGSGTTFKEVSREECVKFPILIPNKHLIDNWFSIVEPIFQSQFQDQQEIDRLQRIRDELLPMLLNGQVSVNDIKGYDFMLQDFSMAAEPEVNCDLSHYHICFQFLFPADVPQYTGKKLYICAIRH